MDTTDNKQTVNVYANVLYYNTEEDLTYNNACYAYPTNLHNASSSCLTRIMK